VNMECGIFILITECLDLPEEHLDYGPLELEPIPRKAIEYCFDDPFAYYASMTRNAARLGAWCWNGKFGDDILQIFPAPELPAMFNVGTRSRIQTYLHFVTQEIAHLLPPDIIDEQFASTLVETLVEVEKAQRDIFKHLYAETKMIGLIHANMQADNAIFWRSDDGSMQSGFIDWGKVKQDTYGWELACGFYAINPPELLSAIDKMLLRIFIDELKAQGGPDISWDVMFEHYRLSWCLLAIDIIAAPEALWSSCEQAKPGAWSTIQSVQDPRVWHMPDVARGNLATIRNLAHIWKRLDLPTFFLLNGDAHILGPAKSGSKDRNFNAQDDRPLKSGIYTRNDTAALTIPSCSMFEGATGALYSSKVQNPVLQGHHGGGADAC